MEIEIQKTAFGGEGLGFIDGKACFVEGALPGERVEIEVLQEKKSFLRGRLRRVLKPSPDREEPPCPHVAHCGGCQYQHARYRAELSFKEEQLREILKQHLDLPSSLIQPIRFAEPYGYRHSVTLHADAGQKKPQRLAFIGRDNRTRVVVQNCLLADPRLAPVFTSTFRLKDKEEEISFRLSREGQIHSSRQESFLKVEVLGESFQTSSRGFFQNNPAVTGFLVTQAIEWLARFPGAPFFDLYAGCGLFSVFAAKTGRKVTAIEENPNSLAAFRMNREEKALSSVEIVEGRVESAFPKLPDETFAGAVLLMDPPRQGIEARLADFLAESRGFEGMIYISCDPMTLARDLGRILKRSAWGVEEIVPFDMFPKTKHLETAVLLKALRT